MGPLRRLRGHWGWIDDGVGLSPAMADPSEAAQAPENLADRGGHGSGGEAEDGPTGRSLGVVLPPDTAPAKPEPAANPGGFSVHAY
jgi:hypothetical protein